MIAVIMTARSVEGRKMPPSLCASSYQGICEPDMQLNTDDRLPVIREKVQAGARLSLDEGLYLYDHADLFSLGELANIVRERKNANFTYYNVNTHLNPTNVCVYRCTFCAFRADLKSP